jgi:hypothetical protein
MGRTEVLQGVRQMRFEALLDRHERGELNQEEAADRRIAESQPQRSGSAST